MDPFILEGGYYFLPYVKICPGAQGFAKINKPVSGHREPRLASLRGFILRQHPDRSKNCVRCGVEDRAEQRGLRQPGDTCLAKRHLDSELIKNKKAGQAEQAGLDSPQLVVSRMAPKFLFRGIRWVVLLLICTGEYTVRIRFGRLR